MANRLFALLLLLAAPAAMLAKRPAPQASPNKLATSAKASALGSLSGKVTDLRGLPQMGALVLLVAPDGRILHRIYTNELGMFLQERVVPGVYHLRVTLASFLPLVRDSVTVQAGGKSFVSVNLASLSDTLASLMGKSRSRPESDDDWKWVVRSSGGLRPALRLFPGQSIPPAISTRVDRGGRLRPDYRARVEFAGGGTGSAGFGGDAEFSTGFSMAQTLFADTTLLLGGNVGFDRSTPASAFRGILRRERGDSTHEMSITVRQIQLPGAYFSRGLSRIDNYLASSLNFEETRRVSDRLSLVYGASYDSVDFLGRVNSINPHGRAIARITPNISMLAAYSQGPERQRRLSSDPLRDVSSQLSAFPHMSLLNGRPELERDRHLEVSYRQKVGAHSSVEATAYRDQIANFAIGVAGQPGEFSGDLLPDVFSDTATLNGGRRQINGVRVAWQQAFGDYFQATASWSIAGLPVPGSRTLLSNNLNELREQLHNEQRQSLALKLGMEAPGSKTRVITSYRWMNGLAILPHGLYSDSLGQVDPNFNLLVRQPLPQLTPFIGKVEALADFRNLLSQGYIPIVTADGKRVVLLQNVRSFRGGFSFNF